MVEGSDSITLDGIDHNWFKETNKMLVNESWRPKPSRRVYIPKANGKMRPLGISGPRDKIVQQAMKLVLEAILEPKFSNLSHGFRPGRSCHSALNEIRKWKGVSWFIEGDIKGFFDNIDHHILEDQLKMHFDDKRFFNLYWKFVKAGYVEWDKKSVKYVNTDMGVPQGGIISPILSNLMLHKLDKYAESLIEKLNIQNGNTSAHLVNPKYHALTSRIHRLKKKIIIQKSRGLNIDATKAEFIKALKARRLHKSLIPNPSYTKISYVRYADDWLIGVWGRKSYAEKLKSNISVLLKELKLELSIEKTLITNARASRAKFLGTFIKKMASTRGSLFTKVDRMSRRVAVGNLWMSAPISNLVKKLEDKLFLKRVGHRWVPKSISKFVALPVKDIIIRYNSIVNGIINYYSFADNRRLLNKIIWILKGSMVKTIRRKLKINNKTFIRRFGKDISVKTYIKELDRVDLVYFIKPDLSRRPMNFMNNIDEFRDPMQALYLKVSTLNAFKMACSSCGSVTNIEMHHLKHIKTINLKLNSFDSMMAKINRKQVPLCKSCHLDVHRGEYKGKALKYLNKIYKPI